MTQQWIGIILSLASMIASSGCVPDEDITPDVQAGEADHFILLTVDTLRGDHFLTERGGVPLTPRLARWAEEGVTFRNATSVSNATSPGIAAIMTGLNPHRSGVLRNKHMLPESLLTLASHLKAQGFITGAFVGNPVLGPGNGFESGFETYRLIVDDGRRRKGQADAITDAALEWLEKFLGGRRLFLWVHYMDPHGPYIPPDSFLALFPTERFAERDPIPLLPKGDNSGFGGIPSYQQLAVSPPSQDSRDYLARYAAEVRFMDHEIGRFMKGLEEMGLMRSSVVALTSDHGEALLNDHGYYFSHQNGLTEDQLRVPLVMSFSGCNAGEKIKFPVSTIDLFPTALELLRVPPPRDFDGVSLFQKGPRKTISQLVGVTSIREGPWKMLAHDNGDIYLYNLHDDRLETRNLISSRTAKAQHLREALAEILKRPQLAKSVRRKRAGKKTEEALRSLGYVH